MKLLDERQQVREAIPRFRANWGDGTYSADRRGRMVGKELSELDPETATGAQVNEIIGNTLWVHPLTCHECGKESWQIVEVGEPPDYESSTAQLCAECLSAALKLARP